MNLEQFKREIRTRIQVGTILGNPGKGTSVISSLSDTGISYIRGKSIIYVSFQDFFEVLKHLNILVAIELPQPT
jgi:DNA replication protein DnaC